MEERRFNEKCEKFKFSMDELSDDMELTRLKNEKSKALTRADFFRPSKDSYCDKSNLCLEVKKKTTFQQEIARDKHNPFSSQERNFYRNTYREKNWYQENEFTPERDYAPHRDREKEIEGDERYYFRRKLNRKVHSCGSIRNDRSERNDSRSLSNELQEVMNYRHYNLKNDLNQHSSNIGHRNKINISMVITKDEFVHELCTMFKESDKDLDSLLEKIRIKSREYRTKKIDKEFIEKIQNLYTTLTCRSGKNLKDVWGWIKNLIKEKKSVKNSKDYLNDYKMYDMIEYKDFCDKLIRENGLSDLRELKVFIRDTLEKNAKNHKNVEKIKMFLTKDPKI